MKTRQKDAAVKKDSDRILIPTKTGKEPPKKLYPKESPPLYGGRFLPLGVGGLPTQPHSLPIYPIQLAGAVPWGQHRSDTTYHTSYSRLVHLDIEDCSEELVRQPSYAIKNQLGHPKPPTTTKYPYYFVFCLLLAGSLWHKCAYNR